jgi:hypothetical protein
VFAASAWVRRRRLALTIENKILDTKALTYDNSRIDYYLSSKSRLFKPRLQTAIQQLKGQAMSHPTPLPKDGELELLQLLWSMERYLSEVHERLGRDVGYTTVQTRLNRLVDKGWIEKVKGGKSPTAYSAVIEPDDVRESQLNRDGRNDVSWFGGSTGCSSRSRCITHK